jgi:hypothetical protein
MNRQTPKSSPSFSGLFPDKRSLVFTDYKNIGLLCFDGKNLVLVSAQPDARAESVLFARVSVKLSII